MRRRVIAAVAVAACGVAAGSGLAQAQQRPSVHIIATGGTIASSASGTIGVEALVAGVPALAEVADLSFQQVLRIGSSRITPADWLDLARAIEAAFQATPGLDGVVVTHGTDSMEETAYFLDLTLAVERPVVVTGAMRSADAVGADGPANLLSAVRVAAHPAAAGRGTLVVMNDEIHEARRVTKTSTLRVHAFRSPVLGAIGVVDADGPFFSRGAPDRPDRFDLSGVTDLPRVEIDYSYAGSDGSAIRGAVGAGAAGAVVASFGSGRVSGGQADAIKEAVARGLPVVLSSRVGSGRVEDAYGGALGGAGRSVILADDLNPQKARVLLIVALTQTRDLADLARIFRQY